MVKEKSLIWLLIAILLVLVVIFIVPKLRWSLFGVRNFSECMEAGGITWVINASPEVSLYDGHRSCQYNKKFFIEGEK